MARKIFLILIVLLILIFFGWQMLSNFVYKEYLTNTTELYTYFTPYMKEKTNSYLQSISCEPDAYYYENSAVCFVCNKADACFNYVVVERTGGQRMSPMLPYLKGEYNKDTELSFYSKGMTKILGCNCLEDECICEEGIKAILVDEKMYETVEQPHVLFEYEGDIKEKINNISNRMNMGDCIFINITFECGKLSGIILDKVFLFD